MVKLSCDTSVVLHSLTLHYYGSRHTGTSCSTASWNDLAKSQCHYPHLDKSCYNNCAHAHWHALTILWKATLSYICFVWVWLGYGVAEWKCQTYPIWTWSEQACLSQTNQRIAVDGIFRWEECNIGGEAGYISLCMCHWTHSPALRRRFQRANGTISKCFFFYFFLKKKKTHCWASDSWHCRYFWEMLDAFSFTPFYTKYVKQPTMHDPSSFFFKDNLKMWPFFQHALGTIDRGHIPFFPPASEWELYYNCKWFCSQNGFFCCTFSLYFTYSLTGWEGSSSDARVYEDSITTDLVVPPGFYLLADAGFPHCKELFIPYQGKCYHLQEWVWVKLKPVDQEELFNLHHAQARNCIEHIFGVVKKHFFWILLLAPEYKKDKGLQNCILSALIAIHNFICHHDQDKEKLPPHYLIFLLHNLQPLLDEILITDKIQLHKPCGIVIKQFLPIKWSRQTQGQ